MLVRRKKDGNLYIWSGFESHERPGHVRLIPKWEGRLTYKLVGNFRKEFTLSGGEPLPPTNTK